MKEKKVAKNNIQHIPGFQVIQTGTGIECCCCDDSEAQYISEHGGFYCPICAEKYNPKCSECGKVY